MHAHLPLHPLVYSLINTDIINSKDSVKTRDENFNADIISVQGLDKGFTSFDLALKKDFNEGRVSSTFQFTNIFATQRRETFINTPDLYSYRLATPRWPFISISFTFRLNNFNNLDKIQTEKGSEF